MFDHRVVAEMTHEAGAPLADRPIEPSATGEISVDDAAAGATA
jgi:hypothetical protein